MARRRGKALCTIATGRFQELLDIAGPTFERYAARHGYVLDVRTELLAPERPPSWSKVVLLRELVAKHRFAMWVDCDAIIVDSRRDLADERRRGKHAYIVEHHYQGQRIPNFGVVGMRGSAWSERFLDQVWSMTEYLDHKWWENAAVLHLLGYSTMEPVSPPSTTTPTQLGVHYVDRRWNSIWLDESPDPAIVHFPGSSHEHRVVTMTELAATAK